MALRLAIVAASAFDPDARIRAAFADWRPAVLADEMMRRYRASLRASGHPR